MRKVVTEAQGTRNVLVLSINNQQTWIRIIILDLCLKPKTRKLWVKCKKRSVLNTRLTEWGVIVVEGGRLKDRQVIGGTVQKTRCCWTDCFCNWLVRSCRPFRSHRPFSLGLFGLDRRTKALIICKTRNSVSVNNGIPGTQMQHLPQSRYSFFILCSPSQSSGIIISRSLSTRIWMKRDTIHEHIYFLISDLCLKKKGGKCDWGARNVLVLSINNRPTRITVEQ